MVILSYGVVATSSMNASRIARRVLMTLLSVFRSLFTVVYILSTLDE